MKPTQQKLTKSIEGWYETEQYNAIGLSQLFHKKKKKYAHMGVCHNIQGK